MDLARVLARGISIIMTSVSLLLIYAAIRKQAAKAYANMDRNNFTIRLPKVYTWAGLICALFFGAIMIALSISPMENAAELRAAYVVFAFFSLGGIFLAAGCILLQIKVNGSEIRCSGLFTRAKTFTFDDIERVKTKQSGQYHQVILYSGNKKLLSIYSYYVGYDVFIDRLYEQEEEEDWEDQEDIENLEDYED